MTERTFFIATPEWNQGKLSEIPAHLEVPANFTHQSTQQSQLIAGMTIITGNDAHHLINVLRKRKGDLVYCLDDGGSYYKGEIVSVVKRGVSSAINRSKMSRKRNSNSHSNSYSSADKSIEVNKLNNKHSLAVNVWLTKIAERAGNKVILPQITVMLSMPHPRTLAAITSKLSECGVKALQIIITERSFIKDVKAINVGRLQRIASEAKKHSGRVQPMEIRHPLKLSELFADQFYSEQFKASHVKNVLFWEHEPYDRMDCGGAERSAAAGRQVGADCIEESDKKNETINIIIGPEGGITREECDLFKAAGVKTASLHPYILKVETAVLLAVARYF